MQMNSKKPLGYKEISANTVLIKEGVTKNKNMYIILAGHAKVYKNFNKPGQSTISKMTQGDFFGEMSLFLDKEPAVSVVASSDMTVLEISQDRARHFFASSPGAAYRIMQILCERIDGLNNKCAAPNSHRQPEYSENVDKSTLLPDNPADQISVPVSAETIPLNFFPTGHKGYVLPDEEKDASILLVKNFSCPVCRGTFMFPVIRNYKLRKQSTGCDMRIVYKGVNVTHYYTVNCPECLFTAVSSMFEKAINKKNNAEILKRSMELKKTMTIGSSVTDADSIFARLYLALEFMPLAYNDTTAYIAQLWLNISWLYRDCGDAEMEKFAIERALEAHIKVYSKIELDSKRLQRICMIIGELSSKTGDIANARKFFFEAKTVKEAFTDLSDMADERLGELKNQT
jgi:uncharacterized protein (DUF2225 family)